LTGSTRPEHFTIGITQDDANVCSKTFRINHLEYHPDMPDIISYGIPLKFLLP